MTLASKKKSKTTCFPINYKIASDWHRIWCLVRDHMGSDMETKTWFNSANKTMNGFKPIDLFRHIDVKTMEIMIDLHFKLNKERDYHE